jgi:hypothetical protein
MRKFQSGISGIRNRKQITHAVHCLTQSSAERKCEIAGKGRKTLMTSTHNGYRPAQQSNAWLLKQGQGVAKDIQTAAQYYEKAVDKDYKPAERARDRCQNSGELKNFINQTFCLNTDLISVHNHSEMAILVKDGSRRSADPNVKTEIVIGIQSIFILASTNHYELWIPILVTIQPSAIVLHFARSEHWPAKIHNPSPRWKRW